MGRLSAHWRVGHFYHGYVGREASHIEKISDSEIKQGHQQNAAEHHCCRKHAKKGQGECDDGCGDEEGRQMREAKPSARSKD